MQPNDAGKTATITPWGEAPTQAIPQPIQPQPQVINQPPQPVMMGTVNPQMIQGASPFNIPVQYPQSYKKIYAKDWLIMGIVSTIFGIMGPGLCWIISVFGAISMATKLNIGNTEPGHPEAEKVKSALIANLVAIILPLIVMVVMISADFY
jgi:hypothetical protein|tara:strand:- start:93 stop:545 length:453 start_codon:yes stop_codon:yes gene_type:complete